MDATTNLPLNYKSRDELSTRPEDIKGIKNRVFLKKYVQRRWNRLLENWEASGSNHHHSEKAINLFPGSQNPTENQLSSSTGSEKN